MKRKEKLFIGLSLVVCLGAATSGQHRPHPKRDEAAQKRFEEFQSLKMELVAERTEWKVGEPIEITLRITNPGANDVGLFDITPDLYKYEIKITGRYNRAIAETAWRRERRAQGVFSAFSAGVKSKGTLEEKIPISRYFQMDEPGIYHIKVKRSLGPVSEKEWFYLESNTLTISVVK